MRLVAFSVRLDRIDESLLFEAKDGSFWLSCVYTYEEGRHGQADRRAEHSKGTLRSRRTNGGLLARDRLIEPVLSGDVNSILVLHRGELKGAASNEKRRKRTTNRTRSFPPAWALLNQR